MFVIGVPPEGASGLSPAVCQRVAQALIQDEFREELSPAGLEVLTLIAYLGPVPRSTVDYIRGVNSSFTLRNLVVRGLVERDPETSRGNLYAYRTTALFLRHLGLARAADLPEYDDYRAKLMTFNQQPSNNPQPTTNNQQQATNENQRQKEDESSPAYDNVGSSTELTGGTGRPGAEVEHRRETGRPQAYGPDRKAIEDHRQGRDNGGIGTT